MKNTIKSLFALSAFGAAALLASAQPAPKILMVDLGKLFDSHYKTEDQITKLRADEAKAQEELERQQKEYNDMAAKYKDLNDQANSPVATAEAKAKAQSDSQKAMDDIRRKQNEIQTFVQNTRNALQQRNKTFRDMMIEEISKVAVDIAKRRGATILVDKSGPTIIGVSNILYSDPEYDITPDVLKEINKDRPATAPATTPLPNTSTAPASDSPTITLPGVKKP